MELKDILAISGKGGLFKFLSQGRNGIIVESFEDKKRMNVTASSKVSALEDIAVYTDEEEVSLHDVLKAIYEKEEGKSSINHKSDPETLKNYFSEVLPDYDQSRVYVSDIKKIINWYNLLHKHEKLNFDEKDEEGSGEETGSIKDEPEKKETDEKSSP